MPSIQCATASKQTMRNIVMVTQQDSIMPHFSPDKAEKKFADLSGNQLPIDFKRLIGPKNFGEIHMSQGIRLSVCLSLPLYSFPGLSYSLL